jgi:hypothetical protein
MDSSRVTGCVGKYMFAALHCDHEENDVMPIISMFYGIIIRLYLIDNQHHNLPHMHAKYAEFEASIGLGDGEILAGDLPRKHG